MMPRLIPLSPPHILLLLAAVLIGCSSDSENISGQITISDLKIKAPVPGQEVAAGYFNIDNAGDELRNMVAVSSTQAGSVEMHRHVHKDGMMGMEKMDAFEIPAGATLEFSPGGNHLMIFSPAEDAIETGSIELVFEFENGEIIQTQASIESWR